MYNQFKSIIFPLHFNRAAGGPPTEFEFVTDANSAMQILKLWNIRLLESIPRTQQRFSEPAAFTTSKNHSSKERRSFRTPKAAPAINDNDLRRTGSFSKMHTLGTGLVGAALPGRRSWGGSNEIYPPPIPSGSQLSQDSMFNSLTSPPPLPPRPEESDSDEDDPDYAYIDENKVKGPENQRGRAKTSKPGGGGRMGSPTLDDQLEALKKDIMRENKKKKREKAATLHFPSRSSPRTRLPSSFVQADPEDYLEPVASKRITSTSSEGVPKRERDRLSPNVDLSRSLSEQGQSTNHSSSSSIGTTSCEVFDDSQTPPDAHGGALVAGPGGNPPALPPRPWRNGSVTSTSSVSSATSPSAATVPPLTAPVSGSHPSVSEEKSVISEVEELERSVSSSPNLSSPKDSGAEQVSQITAAAADTGVVGKGRHLSLKDGSTSPIDQGSPSTTSTSPPPPLPPRSPTRDRDRLSRKSSSSSVSSNASSSRCPRCRSLKKSKTLVSKTISLDQRAAIQAVSPLSKEESRKSLPDLNSASPFPENNLAQNRQRHSHSTSREHNHVSSCSKCSVGSSTDGLPNGGAAAASNGSIPSSSSQNLEYLQLVSEEGEKKTSQQQKVDIDTDVSPALDLLSSCLQDLEYLENKVNQNALPSNSNPPNQLKNTAATALHNSQRKLAAQTDIDAAMKQTELVRAELNMAGTVRHTHSLSSSSIGDSTRKMVANGHPPLLKKRNTITSLSMSSSTSSSSSASPSPTTAPLNSSSSNKPLHWTQQPHPQANHPQGHTNGTVVRKSSSSSLSSPASVGSPHPFQPPSSVFSPGGPGSAAPSPMGGAPPVPPRSLVSLSESQPPVRPQSHGQHVMNRSASQIHTRPHSNWQQRSLSKSNSLGRHMSSWKSTVYSDHHAAQRSSSAAGMVGGPHPAGFQDSPHQSETVFVHHLNRSNTRPRQLKAHLV